MRHPSLLTIVIVSLLFAVSCAEEKKQIAVPVIGQSQGQAIRAQKASMLEKLQSDFPKLSKDAMQAFDSVARYFFITDPARHRAYEDFALPIGSGQTALKLSDMAYLLSEMDIRSGDSVLEIGTGTGYFAAVLSHISEQVYTIEIIEYLAEIASANFERFRLTNIKLRSRDGMEGWPKYAPFSKIIVTAAVTALPDALTSQLSPVGIIAAPFIEEDGSCSWVVQQMKDGTLEEISRRKTKLLPIITP